MLENAELEAEKIINELELYKVTRTRPIMLPSLLKKKLKYHVIRILKCCVNS